MAESLPPDKVSDLDDGWGDPDDQGDDLLVEEDPETESADEEDEEDVEGDEEEDNWEKDLAEPEEPQSVVISSSEEPVAPPLKKKGGRPKGSKNNPALVSLPKAEYLEAERKDGLSTYTVQRGFVTGSKVYQQGDVIPVQCRFCALWEKEWLGKVRCGPGRLWPDGTPLSAERFSCESFFLCKELEPELDTLLGLSLEDLWVVRRLIRPTKEVLAVETAATAMAIKKGRHPPMSLFLAAKNFMSAFTSCEQFSLAEPFIRRHGQLQAAREKTKRKRGNRSAIAFRASDWVEWTDPSSGQVIKGIVMKIAKKEIHITAVEGIFLGRSFTFSYPVWKRSANTPDLKGAPKLLRRGPRT